MDKDNTLPRAKRANIKFGFNFMLLDESEKDIKFSNEKILEKILGKGYENLYKLKKSFAKIDKLYPCKHRRDIFKNTNLKFQKIITTIYPKCELPQCIINISTSGMAFRSKTQLEVNEHIYILLSHESFSFPLIFKGRIVYNLENLNNVLPYRVGVSFIQTSDENSHIITDLVSMESDNNLNF